MQLQLYYYSTIYENDGTLPKFSHWVDTTWLDFGDVNCETILNFMEEKSDENRNRKNNYYRF